MIKIYDKFIWAFSADVISIPKVNHFDSSPPKAIYAIFLSKNEELGYFVSDNGGFGEAPAERAVWTHYTHTGEEIRNYEAMVADCSAGISDFPSSKRLGYV